MNSLIAERFPHPSHALSNIVARPDDRRRVKDLFQDIDFIVGRLRKETDEEAQEIQLEWLARRLIKQFHIDVAIYMIKGPYNFVSKEQHAKNVRDEAHEEEEKPGSNISNAQRCESNIPAVSNNRQRSTDRLRERRTEETDTDHEWHSSESEVYNSLPFSPVNHPKLIDAI